MIKKIRRMLFGRPLHNKELTHQKLPRWKALSIFSSDALSSVGYGPEQIALTFAISGLLVYGYFSYVLIAVLILLTVVTISYAQVARANPGGGGSYSVALHNLGEYPALIAAASLFADYVLTVAVSVSSGTAALISAFPSLVEEEILINLVVLFGILMLINLRGVQESANVFVIPTYLFIVGILALIIFGLYQAFTSSAPLLPAESVVRAPLDWTVWFLVLRAFANGCSSMTGIEAISNGVPTFRQPEVHNAITTTYWMSSILGVMTAGISFLILHQHLLPMENVTMLSQLTESVFARNWFYYYIQISTMLILYLAANTSYNGLPPLLSLMARDGYMPRYLGNRGERLSFSNGIILLSGMAGVLIYVFRGNVEHLISLYAVGVFLSFTIAQMGLVVHWYRKRDHQWATRATINAFGASITGLVVLIIAISKFSDGAWIVLIFIPTMIYIFKLIRIHYSDVSEQLRLPKEELISNFGEPRRGKNIVVIPVATPTRIVVETLHYAQMISNDVIAVHVALNEESGRKVEEQWKQWQPDIPLTMIYSPYRLTITPLIRFIESLRKETNREDIISVLISEFQTKKWWHRLLHNQTGFILRTRLILQEKVVVSTIPYHLTK